MCLHAHVDLHACARGLVHLTSPSWELIVCHNLFLVLGTQPRTKKTKLLLTELTVLFHTHRPVSALG